MLAAIDNCQLWPMAKDLETFADRLSYAIETRHMSAHGVAQKAGFSHGYVRLLARGKRAHPRPDTVFRLALALGVRADWLAFGKGPMDPEDERKNALSRLTPFDVAVLFLQGSVSEEVVDIAGRWGAEHEQWFLTAREWVAILQDLQKQLLSGVSKRNLRFPATQSDVPTLRLVTENSA